jgi:hypothetical protein
LLDINVVNTSALEAGLPIRIRIEVNIQEIYQLKMELWRADC